MARHFELGHMRDGGLVLMSNQPFPADIKRVEYYPEQKLFMLVYEGDQAQADNSELIEYELSDFAANLVRNAASNILVVNAQNFNDLEGFDVPLIRVGV